ncbi:PPM1L, partial [Symbiodinium sp. CCMP2456]
MEDAVAVHSDVAGHTCVAVFDGHGGDKAAKLAKEVLPQKLDHHLRLATDKENAIIEAFEAAEGCMYQELADEASLSPSGTSSGTVACVALLQEKELLFVNLGDCRAVICDGAKVTVVAVKESTEFVVLATDGIWDALQEQTVLTTARKVLRESRSSEAAAQAVLESAAKVSKADN